jgi:osmotically-inducible protein OsmY
MRSSQTRCAPVLGFVLASALSGCAAFDKCQSAGCSDDAKITTAVQANLQKHPELGLPNVIEVQTINHVVYLHGTVSAGEQSAEAVSVAQQTPGVKQVVSNIGITK